MANTFNIQLKDRYDGKVGGIVIYAKFYVNFVDQNGVEYRSNELTELKGVSNESGLVEINADNLINNNEYQKYHRLWWEKIYSDGIRDPETDFFIIGKFYNSSTELYATKALEQEINYTKDGDIGWNKLGEIGNISQFDFDLLSISNDLDITILKDKFKQAEKTYLFAKEEYVNNLKNVSIDTSPVFERVAEYEPTSWVYVITRLLELNEGTIEPALRFTKNAEMSVENKRLTMIQKTIENLLNLYPDITIDDGEGLPYASKEK
jgi:hypothetical protein